MHRAQSIKGHKSGTCCCKLRLNACHVSRSCRTGRSSYRINLQHVHAAAARNNRWRGRTCTPHIKPDHASIAVRTANVCCTLSATTCTPEIDRLEAIQNQLLDRIRQFQAGPASSSHGAAPQTCRAGKHEYLVRAKPKLSICRRSSPRKRKAEVVWQYEQDSSLNEQDAVWEVAEFALSPKQEWLAVIVKQALLPSGLLFVIPLQQQHTLHRQTKCVHDGAAGGLLWWGQGKELLFTALPNSVTVGIPQQLVRFGCCDGSCKVLWHSSALPAPLWDTFNGINLVKNQQATWLLVRNMRLHQICVYAIKDDMTLQELLPAKVGAEYSVVCRTRDSLLFRHRHSGSPDWHLCSTKCGPTGAPAALQPAATIHTLIPAKHGADITHAFVIQSVLVTLTSEYDFSRSTVSRFCNVYRLQHSTEPDSEAHPRPLARIPAAHQPEKGGMSGPTPPDSAAIADAPEPLDVCAAVPPDTSRHDATGKAGQRDAEVSSSGSGSEYRVRTLRHWLLPLAQSAWVERAVLMQDPEADEFILQVDYSDPVTPDSVLQVDVMTGELVQELDRRVPGYNPGDYCCQMEWAAAADGVLIPITLAFKQDTKLQGASPRQPRPLVLSAYGAYGFINSCLAFSCEQAVLMEQGVVLAIAHVRGGGELGTRWHEAGKGMNKPTAVSDLHCCAAHLIERGWTRPSQLGLWAASAGAALAAAVLNGWCADFAAVALESPLVDVVGQLREVHGGANDEWGDVRDAKQLAVVESYSAVANLRQQPYPPVVLTAGLQDFKIPLGSVEAYAQRLQQCGATWVVLRKVQGGHVLDDADLAKARMLQYAFLLACCGAWKAGQD